MEDVAAEAGVTKLIVYRHFESKAELYRSVLEEVTARLRHEFVTQMDEHRHGFTTRSLLTVAREDPDGLTLLLVHAPREPEFASYADQHRRHAVGVANSLLGDTIPDEHIKAWAAETIVYYLIAGVLAWLEHGAPDRDEEFVDLATSGLVALYTSWLTGPAG